jgi:hypothetical protein
MRPIKAFGSPVMDAMGPIPYSALNTMIDPAFPKGALNYWKSQFLTDLSDDAIRTLLDQFQACPSPESMIVLEHFHGAASRVPVDQTACAMRITGFNVAIISQWSNPAATDAGIAWARDTYDALGPFFGATRYVNYLDNDVTGDPAAVAYGANYERLRQIKAVYDPENFFHTNVNIRPASA